MPTTIRREFGYLTDPVPAGSNYDTLNTLPAAPVLASAVPSASGGTLTAGTYFYKVSAILAGGETAGSNELSATTTGTTSSVVVTWATVAGATGYRIYRGTVAGLENVYYTVGTVLTYTDTNAASTPGTPSTSSAVIADAGLFWPVINANHQWGGASIDRNNEVRGVRAGVAPIPFKRTPMMTVEAPAYRSVAAKLLKLGMGSEGAVTGSAAAGYTHPLSVLPFGSTQLPAIHAQIVRDNNNHKMAGAIVEHVTANFPADNEGHLTLELHGLYMKEERTAVAMPTAVFTDLSPVPLLLRDCVATFDGGTAILDIVGFEISIKNNMQFDVNRHYSGRNVEQSVIGAGSVTRKLWWPYEHKLAGMHDITYTLHFGNTNDLQEQAMKYGQLQKLVVTVTGDPIPGTTGPVLEQLQFNLYQTEHTSGGPDPLASRGDIASSYSGNAWYSSTDGTDILVNVLDGNSGPL